MDNSFVQTGVGLNNQVLAVAVQPEDGKILVGGKFTTYNGNPAPYLIRLNPDGTRDSSFVQTGTGLNAYVNKIVVLQPGGQILVSGAFSSYNSDAAKRIARLNSTGTLDTSFSQTGAGLSHTVYAMDVQPDGKIVAGGYFSQYNGISVGRIIRLNSEGARDTSFSQTGTGFNDDPNFIEVQSDGKILVG